MPDHIVFVRFFPFYTPLFPYSRFLCFNDDRIEPALSTLRDEWWRDFNNRVLFRNAQIEKAERQLKVELYTNGLFGQYVLGAPRSKSQGPIPKRVDARIALVEAAVPRSVEARMIRLDHLRGSSVAGPTNPPDFERLATVAGWMRPPPSGAIHSRGVRGMRIVSSATSPPGFRAERIAAAAPCCTLPSLESFRPYYISPRYPVAIVADPQLAEEIAEALQVRVTELARGANAAQGRDELEILYNTANPRFFVVPSGGISRTDSAIAMEMTNRLGDPVLGTPSAEERLVRVYWPAISRVVHTFDALLNAERRNEGESESGACSVHDEGIRSVTVSKEPVPSEIPVWSGTAKVLRFRGQECKRFKKRAPTQELILAVFQEEGWPEAIDDPLKPGQLASAVESLNDRLKYIKFSRNGENNGVCWQPSPRPVDDR